MTNALVPLIAVILSATPGSPQAVEPQDTLWRVGLTRGVFMDVRRLGLLDEHTAVAPSWIRAASDEVRWRLELARESAERERAFHVRLLAPEIDGAFNSDLPFSLNEGSLWAGRGLSGRTQLGAVLSYGSVSLVLAPEVWATANGAFQTFSYPEAPPREDNAGGRSRHPLASPFHYPPHSMDLPQRLGSGAGASLGFGQSSLAWDNRSVRIGIASESMRWGPALRNPLMLSNNAQGFTHLFAQTTKPLDSPLGNLHAQWVLGDLQESEYFDFDPSNDHRSFSGAIIVLNPSFEPNLSLGVSRVVYAPASSRADVLTAAFDVLKSVGTVASEPGDTLLTPGPDRLFSMFAHWSFPDAGMETWGEWGRAEEPESLRDFLETPHHSRAYTFGLRHVRPIATSSRLSIEAELTSLEPSQAFRVKQHGEWYASRRVVQGYTHRGRVIGAAIGPSGSSQWLAFDWLGQGWHVGLFGTRIRWENEALYSYAPEFRRADVTLMAGLRGAGQIGPLGFEAAWAESIRLNYLFQTQPRPNDTYRGVDLRNRVIRLTFRAAGW